MSTGELKIQLLRPSGVSQRHRSIVVAEKLFGLAPHQVLAMKEKVDNKYLDAPTVCDDAVESLIDIMHSSWMPTDP